MERTFGAAVIETILMRTSVRTGFAAEPISRDHLRTVLGCGLAAPSSKNAQPWGLHVVDDREQLRFIARAVATARGIDDWVPHDPRTGLPDPQWSSTVRESAAVLFEAPCGVFIENRGRFSRGRRELAATPQERLLAALDGYAFECMGIGAALENLWLAASALGLQVAFLGDVVIAEEAVRERFGIEGDLMGVVCLGYPIGDTVHRRASKDATTDPRVVWH